MAKFNNRSWILNRFKGLYPEVMKDLSKIDVGDLEWFVDHVGIELAYKPLDFDTEEGVQALTEMVKHFVETWKEFENGEIKSTN